MQQQQPGANNGQLEPPNYGNAAEYGAQLNQLRNNAFDDRMAMLELRFESELSDLKSKQGVTNAELGGALGELQVLRGRYDVAVAELRSQDTKLKDFQRLSAEVAELRSKYGNSGSEMTDLKQRYSAASTEMMEMKSRYTSAIAELNDIKTRYNAAMMELGEMRSKFGSSSAELSEMRSKHDSASAMNSELTNRIGQLYDTLNRVEQERMADKVNMERLVRDLQTSRNVNVQEMSQRDQQQEAQKEELRSRQQLVMGELASLMRDVEHYR